MNRPVEIFVINHILVVPDSRRRIRHPVTDESDAIYAGRRLDRIDCDPRLNRLGGVRRPPGIYGRFGPNGGSRRRETECRRPGNGKPPVGDVVVHVRVIDALAGIRGTPGKFMRRHILGFGKIGCADILSRVQVADGHQQAVRRAGVRMAGMVVGVRSGIPSGIHTCERINPRA